MKARVGGGCSSSKTVCPPPPHSRPHGCSSLCREPGGLLASLLHCVRGSYEAMSLHLGSACGWRGGGRTPLSNRRIRVNWLGVATEIQPWPAVSLPPFISL